MGDGGADTGCSAGKAVDSGVGLAWLSFELSVPTGSAGLETECGRGVDGERSVSCV
jgi:hypothetical protein